MHFRRVGHFKKTCSLINKILLFVRAVLCVRTQSGGAFVCAAVHTCAHTCAQRESTSHTRGHFFEQRQILIPPRALCFEILHTNTQKNKRKFSYAESQCAGVVGMRDLLLWAHFLPHLRTVIPCRNFLMCCTTHTCSSTVSSRRT